MRRFTSPCTYNEEAHQCALVDYTIIEHPRIYAHAQSARQAQEIFLGRVHAGAGSARVDISTVLAQQPNGDGKELNFGVPERRSSD